MAKRLSEPNGKQKILVGDILAKKFLSQRFINVHRLIYLIVN